MTKLCNQIGNPINCLVWPVLDGNNYHSRDRSMETLLSVKNKFEFVDGTMPKLEKNIKSIWLGKDATNDSFLDFTFHF